jgi:hypothetical protein
MVELDLSLPAPTMPEALPIQPPNLLASPEPSRIGDALFYLRPMQHVPGLKLPF